MLDRRSPAVRTFQRVVRRAVAAFVVAACAATPALAVPYKALRIETAPGGYATQLDAQMLVAGDTLTAYIAAYDQFGLYWGAPAVDWNAIPNLLVLSPAQGPSVHVQARTTGTARLHATDISLEAWSGWLDIEPGLAATVCVTRSADGSQPDLASLSVSTDSTLVLYAGSRDAFGNWTGTPIAAWSLDAPLGTLQPGQAALTVFDPQHTGSTTLRLNATGLPPLALPVQIIAGRLQRLQIGLATGGALGDTLLVAGASLALGATGFDADANPTPLPSVAWSMTGSGIQLAPSTGSTTTLQAAAPGTARVVATRSGVTASTGLVRVVAGPLARLRISRAPDSLQPFTATTQDADQMLELFGLGEDGLGNSLGPVAANWTSTNPSVARPLNAAGGSVLIELLQVGQARFVASRPGAAPDTTGTLNVVPGMTVQLRIESRSDGTGSPIGSSLLSADSTLALHAIGRDRDGNFTGARAARWTLSDPIGDLSTALGPLCVLDAKRTGRATITATDFLLQVAAGPIEVVPGTPRRARVEDATGHALTARVLQPGDGLEAVAAALDADGNRIGEQAANWTWSGDALAALPPGLASHYAWTAARAGKARLVVQAFGLQPDSSGMVRVATGEPARLEIQDDAGIAIGDRGLSADSTLSLHAVAFDSGGNRLGEVPVVWSVEAHGGLATVMPQSGSTTLLRPQEPGAVVVIAQHASSTSARTGSILIAAGALSRVGIETAPDGSGVALGPRTFTAGETLTLYAVGRDAGGHALGPVEASWVVQGGIGRVVPSFGTSSTFVAEHTGSGTLRLVHPTATGGTSGLLQVVAAAGTSLAIERGAGDPYDLLDTASIAADDSLQAFAVLRDAFGNWVADVPASWSLSLDPGASLSTPGPSAATWLRPIRVGTARLRAQWSSFAAETGPIDVRPGPLVRVTVETRPDGAGMLIGDRSLVAGQRLDLAAVGRDLKANFVAAVDVRWTADPGVGTLEMPFGPSTTLVTQAAASGRVRAEHALLAAATTGILSVGAGSPTQLRIERTPGEPDDPIPGGTLSADDSLQAFAVLRDGFGNIAGTPAVTWSVAGDPGAGVVVNTPAASTWFFPRHPGTARLHASWNGFEAETGSFTLQPGRAVGSIPILVAPDTLRADGHARARLDIGPIVDRAGNLVADGTRVELVLDRGTLGTTGDLDLDVAGVQRATQNGRVDASLIAPMQSGSGRLDVTSGAAAGQAAIPYLPVVRIDAIAGGLTPIQVLHGGELAARLRVQNRDALGLQVQSATLRIQDGNGTRFETGLAHPARLEAAAAGELEFVAGTLPSDLDSGSYAPAVELRGQDDIGQAFIVLLELEARSLVVASGAMAQVRGLDPDRLTAGAPVQFEVEVWNLGDVPAQLDAARCVLRDSLAGFSANLGLTSDIAFAPGVSTWLGFAPATWPATSPLGAARLKLELHGTQPGGAFVQTLVLPAVEVESPARLAPVAGSLTPPRAPVGSDPALRLVLRNSGGSALLLDTRTTLQAAGRSAALAVPAAIAADSVAELTFAPLDLDAIAPGRLALQLAARGVQNGAPFAQDLALPDSLLWFEPAALTILGVVPSQTSVTRDQTEPWNLDVLLLNSGQSQYRIDAAAVRIVLGGLDRTDSYTLVRQKPGLGLVAPAALDTLSFQVTRTGPDVGPATLEASLRATDLQSGRSLEVDTYLGGKGSVRVQYPAQPVLGALTATQPTVVAGQTRGVDCRLDIRNDGEAALLLDTDQLAASLATTPPVPFAVEVASGRTWLGAGESLALKYRLGPFAVGAGPLVLQAAPRLVEANRNVALAVAASETLLVQTPGLPVVTGGTAPQRVTRGQTPPWTARFQIENRGQSGVRLNAPRLAFRTTKGTDVTAGWNVQAPAGFDAASDFELPGGAARALTFTVTATDTVARDLKLWLDATALELDSGRTLAVAPGTSLPLRVQTEPRLALEDSTLAPRAASRGQLVDLRIVAHNRGESSLDLDPAHTVVRLDGTNARAVLAVPARLVPGTPVELRFTTLTADVPAGLYPLAVHFEGTENGNPYSADVKTAATLRVDAASSLEVLSMAASQPLVTSGQERPWSVRVAVRNHGAAAELEAATLVFSLGAEDASAGFAWRNPDRFGSGSALLAAGAIDTLLFDIDRTATLEGVIVIDARLRARDWNSGAQLETQSLAGSRASIRAVAQARPILAALQPSQGRVSAGQTGTWNVRMVLRNDGGTEWIPDWSRTGVAIGAADDSLEVPAGFESGAAGLDPGETATAVVRVRRTGAETGTLALTASLAGMQPTDGRWLDAAPAPPVTLIAESAGRARLESFESLLPRPAAVNAGALLPLGLGVANAGSADLAACWVRLRAAGASPAETLLVTAPAGNQSVLLQPQLRVAKGAAAVDLEAEIVLARDVNDSTALAAWEAPMTRSLRLVVETPGSLQLAVLPSQTRLSGGQTSPWWVVVRAANGGGEPLRLPAPHATDVEFRRAGVPQPDYVVLAPDSLEEGGREIPGGQTRTLRYRVARTGQSGGSVVVAAALTAEHANAPQAPSATASATAGIEVDAEPGIRVLSTESITWRRLHGHDDYRVNSGQDFALRIVVENTGGTYLDSIQVEIVAQRGNSHFPPFGQLGQLAPGERGQLELPAVAGDWLSQPGLPESFEAYVTAARDRNTGLSVLPGAALDNTAFAYVEAPASLELTAWIESPEGARDGTLSARQAFVVAAHADNRGAASISDSGRMALHAPAGFDLEAGEPETFFAAGEIVRWTLRAPAAPLPAPDSLVVDLTALPQDENDGRPAHVTHARDAMPVEVHASTGLEASIAILGPDGALDGTVSAGQPLDLEVTVRGGLDRVDREAELFLPAGWLPQPGQTPKLDLPVEPESHAVWRVVAGSPQAAALLRLQVTSRDQNDDSMASDGDTLQFAVVRPARLALGAAIVAPEAARDGRVLPGQTFTLRARVRDQGDAGVTGDPGATAHGALRLAPLPAGWVADGTVHEFDLARGTASADWRITAPAVWRPDVETLRVLFDRLPRDANSGNPAGLDPDSTFARVGVSLAGDGMVLDVEPAAAKLAVPGQRRVPLLVARIENRAESAVVIDSLGALQLADGLPAAAAAFSRLVLVRDGHEGESFEAVPGANPVAWIGFPAASAAAELAPGATARFTLFGDIAPAAAARRFSVSLRATSGTPLLRVLESGSGTPMPVRVDAQAALESTELHVVSEVLQAYNAPNPFHVGRETTTIHYQVPGEAQVHLGVYTLQGALVWESDRHEAVAGPELRGVEWDGRNGAGHAVRNGVYVCEVRVGSQSTRFKIAVVR